MIDPIPLLQLAGGLHLGFLTAGALMPRAVGLPEHLQVLPAFPRRLFWMYYCFIGLCLVSFGAASLLLAPQLAEGTLLSRAVCMFLAVFWTLRLVFATWLLDLDPYLTTAPRKIGYHLLNSAFALLVPIYIYGAVAGGQP